MPTAESLGPAAPPWAELQFGPYRLLGPHGPLLQSGRAVDLPRKPLAILWLLASRAGEVVHKDELLAIVWPRVVVSDGVIATCMRDLRQALGDDARAPRFIATAHRIGYRFIGEVAARAAAAAGALLPQATPPLPEALVGRSAECAVLQAALQRAAAGQRQIVFVTGDAGIGKSRLVDAFVATLGAQRAADAAGTGAARVGQGQCIEHFGAGEPYLPVLEAITRLCRKPMVRRWSTCCSAMRRAGRPRCRASSGTRRTPLRCRRRVRMQCSACHASWPKRSTWPLPTGCWSWCSKTCTGAIHRRWTGSRCWRGGVNRRGCW